MQFMKYLRLTILALSFNSLYLAAQSGIDSNYCWNNTNTITTAWNSTAGGNQNNWDWTSPTSIEIFPESGMTGPGEYIPMPYNFGVGPGTGISSDNLNLEEYILRFFHNQSQDIYPEQGWELVLKNFGTPNRYINGTLVYGMGTSMPYFILYNKFTGKMKIFIALERGYFPDSHTQAVIDLYFYQPGAEYMTGLFNHTEAIAYSLDNIDKYRSSHAVNYLYPHNPGYFWFVSQFETAYDPCTCNLINSSLLEMTVNLFAQDPVQASVYGRDMDIYAPRSCDRLSIGTYGSLLSGYGTSYGFVGSLISILSKQPELKQHAILNEWYKTHKAYIQSLGNIDWDTLDLSARLRHFDQWAYIHHNEIKKLLGFKPNTTNLSTNTNLATYSPLSAALLGMPNAVFSADSAASPMAFFPDAHLVDDYVGDILTLDRVFKTPGTARNIPGGQQNLTPFYNNTLGVFGLLKNPKIEYAQLNNVYHTMGVDNEQAWNISHSNEYNSISNQHIKQYRLAEDVEYIINPQSEMNVLGIDASIVLEYPNTENLHIYNTEDFVDNYAIPYHDSMGCSDADNCNDLNASIQSIERAGWVLDYASNGLERMPSGTNDKRIKFRTPYVPLEQLKNTNFMLFGGQTPKTYLKMVVTLQHKSDTTIRNTQVVSYDITQSMAQASYTGINKNIDCYVRSNASPGWVYLSNPKYDHWEIKSNPSDTTYGLPFSNPFYTHRKDITLSSADNTPYAGHVSFASNTTLPDNSTYIAYNGFTIPSNVNFGQNTTLISGTPIEFPNGVIPNNVNLIINHNPAEVLFNADPNADIAGLKATDAAINSLCNSYQYRDNLEMSYSPPVSPSSPITAEPNPFTDVIKFNLDIKKDGVVSLYVYDMLGHLVKVIEDSLYLRAGQYITTWDSNNLQTGVYIVVLKSEDAISNVKIIRN